MGSPHSGIASCCGSETRISRPCGSSAKPGATVTVPCSPSTTPSPDTIPAALEHPVQQAALLDVVTLLQFEIFCCDQLAGEAARSLKPGHRSTSQEVSRLADRCQCAAIAQERKVTAGSQGATSWRPMRTAHISRCLRARSRSGPRAIAPTSRGRTVMNAPQNPHRCAPPRRERHRGDDFELRRLHRN
jgi:hypothetical protein